MFVKPCVTLQPYNTDQGLSDSALMNKDLFREFNNIENLSINSLIIACVIAGYFIQSLHF